MTNFAAPAAEVFQLLQSYDYTVMLFGEDGNRVEDPSEARRMFARPENLMVSLVDDGDNSCVRLYLGKSTRLADILGLINSLRTAASKFSLLFNVQQYGKEIEPKDFAGEAANAERFSEAAVSETAQPRLNKGSTPRRSAMEQLLEGMYGTSRSSYLALEGRDGHRSRMIVRHSQKVDETKLGARSRFVESILIENADGERMRFPTTGLVPARAMAQHVSMGGGFADPVGQQIAEHAKDYANLGACASYVAVNEASLDEAAGQLRERCRCKMREMKKMFERMCRSENGYVVEAKKLEDEARTLNETDADARRAAPEQLAEVRRALNLENSQLLADAVFESVCRCLKDEALVEAPAAEAATVSVLGRAVSAEAWEKLKAGKIDLFGKPKALDARNRDSDPSFADKSGELAAKLGWIVPLVRDDSLLNLLSFVYDRMPEERDPAVVRKMRTLALFVVKAAGLPMNEGLAWNNRAVRGLQDWIGSFGLPGIGGTEGRADGLRESAFALNPYEADTSLSDAAEERADVEFDVHEFMSSSFGADLLHGDGPLGTDVVKAALEDYFVSWAGQHADAGIDDAEWLADRRLGEVIANLAREGRMVVGRDDAEDDHLSLPALGSGSQELLDSLDPVPEGAEPGDGELTREDVLLPPSSRSDSLKREVTPRTVRDPDTGKETLPDEGYADRVRARGTATRT